MIPLLRNRYRIIKVLSNEGGFSKTYLAEDIDKLNELCVVKQFAPKFPESTVLQKAIELFQEEAKRLQQLGENSQIPTLFAYFEQNMYLFLVQQYIDGENLRKEVERTGQYGEKETRRFLLDLLPVLKFIHERGVIHRDIKPQNIIRRRSDGRLVLIDFGASKQLSTTVQTKTGTTIGSHGYTPIEQMQYGQAYAASDLFSLGATCFFLLTGMSPSDVWMQKGYSWVTGWQEYLASPISAELAQVINKLLTVNYQERYQSADEVYKSIVQQLSPPPLLPPTLISSKLSIRLNNQRMFISIAVLLIGLGGVWYLQYRSSLEKTVIAPVNEPANSTSGDRKLTDETSSNDHTTNTPVANDGSSENLRGHSSDVNTIAFNPTGLTIASGSDDKSIILWDLQSKLSIGTLTGHTGYIYSIAFAPDGKMLASGGSDKTIILWDVERKKQIATLKGHEGSVTSIAFAPDGKTLASGSLDGTVRLWNTVSQQQIATPLKGHNQPVSSIAFTLDSYTLISSSYDSSIVLWDVVSKQKIITLKGHKNSVFSIALSPDSLMLASSGEDRTIQLWDLATQQRIRTFLGHTDRVNSVAFSPDGKKLVSGSHDNTIRLWDLDTGEEIRVLKKDFGNIYSVAFSPDGQTIASGGTAENILKIWQVSQ
ncbi:hypothetical protein NUACC21_52070 [Scytonema sp. NUACC21]